MRSDAFVFSDDPQGPVPLADSTSRAFRQVRHEAGLDHVGLHDLGHFVATRLLTAGRDVRTASGGLWRSLTSTTLDVYAAFVPNADRQATEIIERVAIDAKAA